MKITKYIHSCLLVETPELSLLIDPGKFTADSKLLNLAGVDRLDYIILTHEHMDHYDLPYLQVLTKEKPQAKIIAPEELVQKIKLDGIANPISATAEGNIEIFKAPHESLPLGLPIPPNIGVHIEGKLTHPGDAWDIPATREILALPLT
jgi:L-ascorbate metabolism protein UlaG (beta-lactamase superfamily)